METQLGDGKALTLLDVVATVSGLAEDETEAAAVINHLLSSEQIVFDNPPPAQDLQILAS